MEDEFEKHEWKSAHGISSIDYDHLETQEDWEKVVRFLKQKAVERVSDQHPGTTAEIIRTKVSVEITHMWRVDGAKAGT